MDSINNITRKLKEKRINESAQYYVIDKTDGNEKYKVPSKEAAEQRVEELVDSGSDRDKITISPISDSAKVADSDSLNEEMSRSELIQKCKENPTWQNMNRICTKYDYVLSEESRILLTRSGKKQIIYGIDKKDRDDKYLPDIILSTPEATNESPTFKVKLPYNISTLDLRECESFLNAVNKAYGLVKELRSIDLYSLYQSED